MSFSADNHMGFAADNVPRNKNAKDIKILVFTYDHKILNQAESLKMRKHKN